MSVDTTVRAAVVCPACRAQLEWSDATAVCSNCGAVYDVLDEIPILRPPDLGPSSEAQAQWFDDAVDEEFEIERPRGLPELYGWLLGLKFAKSVRGIDLAGKSVLAVCGGSGLDAEFLARSGARAICADISLGAARRAAERARRHDVEFMSVVADAERLPFADRSIDVVYVHDGLHHISNPMAGLREMARVARKAVCVTEPADALATSLAVRVGLALLSEDAGNRVARLRLGSVCDALRAEGFTISQAKRYAMLYRHEPGPIMRLLSVRTILPFAKTGFVVTSSALGRAGNKLVVQAVRP
jgi:ubiquinone/menaquinone biosynthesis C-methylase UbiE/uncharacterized protein YbaR (Trm112 family)